MFYPFPYIKHVDQVCEALQGREEFIITEKPSGYIVSNYLVNFEDTFPPVKLNENGEYASKEDEHLAIRRECRGIKFDAKTGLVIQRLYHKFFNFGERAETQMPELADYIASERLLEKLDGSMVAPLQVDGKIIWTTKMGESDVAIMAQDFINKNPQYDKLAKQCIDTNLTPIFEFCSRKQRIVIDYPEDMLILTAVRENYTGRYLSSGEISYLQSNALVNIPEVKASYKLDVIGFNNNMEPEQLENDLAAFETTNGLIDIIRKKENIEGYVLRFRNGHMLKIKCDEYCKIHKSKDKLRFEKDVIDLIVSEKLDDVKPFLSEADLKRVTDFETDFHVGVNEFIKLVKDKFYFGKTLAGEDKKKFAVEFALGQDTLIKGLLFQLWDGKDARSMVMTMIKQNLGSQTTVNGIRKIFNANWNSIIMEE